MGMTSEKMVEALEGCYQIARKAGYEARERVGKSPSVSEHIEHAMWMSKRAQEFVDTRREKAMRWLGYVQGVLALVGLADIDTLKKLNEPDVDSPLRVHASLALRPFDGGPHSDIVVELFVDGERLPDVVYASGPKDILLEYYQGHLSKPEMLAKLGKK